MSIRENAQSIIESRAKATPAPLKAEGMGSEGYNLYAQVDGGSYRDNLDTLGFRGCIGEIRAGKDWAQLRGNAKYIEKAWNDAPNIARKLIEALDALEKIAGLDGVGNTMAAKWATDDAKGFLASLDQEGD